jgi:dimethylamine monooxygenase subunit A
MHFDFFAAVKAPFRMQPGLRKLAPGSPQLTPLEPGSRHQREKLAVLSAYWQQALQVQNSFDASLALHTVCEQAALEHPEAWAWDGQRAHALKLSTAVDSTGDSKGEVTQTASGVFGLGDEVARCLAGLPAAWRLAGLLSLAFAEDLAVVNGHDGCIPWLCITLPSHWAPEEKIGKHFASVHAPVADNQLLLQAADALTQLVTGDQRWERFVWNVSDNPRLHAHPAHVSPDRWLHTPVQHSWFRTERQTFIPVPGAGLAVFTIAVDVQPLAHALPSAAHAQALHDALASMSDSVLAYRGLSKVRGPLLSWLDQHCASFA